MGNIYREEMWEVKKRNSGEFLSNLCRSLEREGYVVEGMS